MIPKRKIQGRKKISRKKISWGKVVFSLAAVAFFGSLVYTLFFSGLLGITAVNLSGTVDLDKNAILEAASGEISGKYFNILEKNNLIFANGGKIASALTDKFKRIEKAEVEKKFPGTINIKIIERKSMLVFCSAGNCFAVDEKGVAYARADFESAELKENKLVILKEESGRAVDIGEQVLDRKNIEFILSSKEKMKSEFDIDLAGDFETPNRASMDIRAFAREGWKIYFGSDLGIDKEMEMLRIILENKIEKEKMADLEYIDLRIENKVFYKFKGEVQNNTEVLQNDTEVKGEAVKKKDEKKKKK
ncbi:MAG: hypothetical protein QG620_516 [Patescibacteria group bacterium]|nr:hypothetical protein [Patescibacteria group bacterium]